MIWDNFNSKNQTNKNSALFTFGFENLHSKNNLKKKEENR